MTVDVLAVGPHPDDVELGVGGLLCKLAASGYTTAILDLTRGELATRGSVQTRAEEAAEAARILGVADRSNAELPDGGIANTPEQRNKVIRFIRLYRPKALLASMDDDRHPDHDAAHRLVRDANYLAGLSRIRTDHDAYRASLVYCYRVYGDPTMPQLVIDISEHFDTKIKALEAYASQFRSSGDSGEETYVSSEAFWQGIRQRAEYWGNRIGTAFGEPLYTAGPIGAAFPPGLEGARCE